MTYVPETGLNALARGWLRGPFENVTQRDEKKKILPMRLVCSLIQRNAMKAVPSPEMTPPRRKGQ